MIDGKITVNFHKIIEGVGKDINQIIVASVSDLSNDISEHTPIDTGFARASWWNAIDGAPGAHPAQPTEDNIGAGGLSPPIMFQAPGHVFSILNNAKYIRRLEFEGWSPQAPSGWVRAAAARFPEYVRRRAAELGYQ